VLDSLTNLVDGLAVTSPTVPPELADSPGINQIVGVSQ